MFTGHGPAILGLPTEHVGSETLKKKGESLPCVDSEMKCPKEVDPIFLFQSFARYLDNQDPGRKDQLLHLKIEG